MLENFPLLQNVSFTNTLTQSVVCLFILLTVSFMRRFHFHEIRSIYSFMVHDFGVVSKKPNPRLSKFSPMLSSRNVIVLHFTFTFGIHFKLVFVNGVKIVSRFVSVFVLHLNAHSFQHCSLERLIFAPFYCLYS